MSDPQQPVSNLGGTGGSGGSAGPRGGGWPEEPSADAAAPQISQFDRLWKVLVAPQETFRAIAARPTWLLIFALSFVVTMGLWSLLVPKIDFAESMRQQLEQQGKEMPAGAEKMAGLTKVFTLIGAGIGSIAVPLIVAAVFLLFNLLGGRLRYAASLSVLLHSGVPGLIKALLSIPVIFSRESLTLQDAQTGLLKSSVAAFAPEGTGPRLMVLLANLDVFTIWSILLLIVGYSVAARVSKTTSALIVLGGWIALMLVGVLFAGLRPS